MEQNIIKQIIDLCNSNSWSYQIEPTGVGHENELLIWDNQDNEIDLYFDDEDGESYPNVISWTEHGTMCETKEFEVIEKIIKNNLVD